MTEATVTVRRYAAADQRDWDAFVGRSRTRHFLFHRGYMDYHADRFEDHSLMLFLGERLVGLVPGDTRAGRFRSHGGLTFGGVLCDERMTANLMLEAFDSIRGHLRAAGIGEWLYKPVPHIYSAVPAEEDLYALYRNDATLVRRDLSSSIRLSCRVPYSKGRKSSVKRAQGASLQLEWSDAFADFMALEAEMLERRHGTTPTHSPGEMSLLAERFPDNIKLMVARRDGQMLAGAIVYATPLVAHTQYIAASEEGHAVGAVDAVIDELIRSYDGACSWFDFGISTEEDGRVLNAGLVRNKESYGARSVVYDWWLLKT